jgi:hypothetical protein
VGSLKREVARLRAQLVPAEEAGYVSWADPRSEVEFYRDYDLDTVRGEGPGWELTKYCCCFYMNENRTLTARDDEDEVHALIAEEVAQAQARLCALDEGVPAEEVYRDLLELDLLNPRTQDEEKGAKAEMLTASGRR